MSFDSRNLIVARGDYNNYGIPTGLVIHTYADPLNLLSTITAPGFLPDYLGEDAEKIKLHDILLIRDSVNAIEFYRIDGVSPIVVTAIAPGADPFDQSLNTTDSPTFANETITNTLTISPGGTGLLLPTDGATPSALNYYEEYTDASFIFGASPWASQQAIILRAVRINEKVTIRLNNASAAASTSDFISSTSSLPTQFRPSEDSWCTLPIINNGANQVGKAKIQPDGIIQIFSDITDGNFDTPSTAGWYTSTLDYFVQDA